MTRNKEVGEAMLAVAATAPPLLLRLGISYLRYKRQAKRAGKSFFRSLVVNGIPEKEARDLADEYMTSFSFRNIVRQLGLRKPVPAKK
jgi:hypothetical protein